MVFRSLQSSPTQVDAGNRTGFLYEASMVRELYQDLDALLGCEFSFLIGPWISDAKTWTNRYSNHRFPKANAFSIGHLEPHCPSL